MINSLIRTIPARELLGFGKTQQYDEIRKGLHPKPVRIGTRATGFPANEMKALIDARIAGKSDSEIRTLIAAMHAARQQLA